jgi:hypothetical protein
VGQSLWYVATFEEQWVALLGWGAAALECGPRDIWIGWTPSRRLRRLHLTDLTPSVSQEKQDK